MNSILNAALDEIWDQIETLVDLRTPDNTNGKPFRIASTHSTVVNIETARGAAISIQRDAFLATLRYLIENHHIESNRCEIRSSNDINLAGPLCRASRSANNNVRVINYIAPILAAIGFLRIDGNQPNTTWII